MKKPGHQPAQNHISLGSLPLLASSKRWRICRGWAGLHISKSPKRLLSAFIGDPVLLHCLVTSPPPLQPLSPAAPPPQGRTNHSFFAKPALERTKVPLSLVAATPRIPVPHLVVPKAAPAATLSVRRGPALCQLVSRVGSTEKIGRPDVRAGAAPPPTSFQGC